MDKAQIEAELIEARRAFSYSEQAIHTHGHQSISWLMWRRDHNRICELEAALQTEAIAAQ